MTDSLDDGFDIPGPIDRGRSSHWIEYDHDAKTVETWVKMGPKFCFKLRSRVRPMRGTEIILSEMRNCSKEEIQRALGIWVEPKMDIPRPWWKVLYESLSKNYRRT